MTTPTRSQTFTMPDSTQAHPVAVGDIDADELHAQRFLAGAFVQASPAADDAPATDLDVARGVLDSLDEATLRDDPALVAALVRRRRGGAP